VCFMLYNFISDFTMPPKPGKTRLAVTDKRSQYLGHSKDLLDDDLPTFRAAMRYGMLLKEQASSKEMELDVQDMSKAIYRKIVSLYYKANAQLTLPVILNEKAGVQKISRFWNDVNNVVWNKKCDKKKIEAQLDRLLDIMTCQCPIMCVKEITCTMINCSHKNIASCLKDVSCSSSGCSHKKVNYCVNEVSCTTDRCFHRQLTTCTEETPATCPPESCPHRTCVKFVTCKLASCQHLQLSCCVKKTPCPLKTCYHKKSKSCVEEVPCSKATCTHIPFTSCMCPIEHKLPKLELTFIRAQRLKVGDKCAYKMGHVDKEETSRQAKTLARKDAEQEREIVKAKKLKLDKEEEISNRNEVLEFMEQIPDIATTDANDNLEYRAKRVDDQMKKALQNRISFPSVAAVSLRYGASDRMTAAIATAALIDAGLVREEDSSMVLDSSKVHREKKRLMVELRHEADERYREEDIKCILFDGRKNWTNVMLKDEDTGKYYQTREKLEHIVVTNEPGGEYLFHFIPSEATASDKPAKQVSNKIVEWLKEYGADTTLDSIGGDSTNSNTGCDGGSFTWVERMLSRKLTWLVCSLHLNELPLRHLIADLDGKTNSDHSFSGPIGKALANVVNLEINPRFQAIKVGCSLIELKQEVIDDLSTDQLYGYRMVSAIRAGVVPDDLANLDIGPVNHARWLTTANRILRMWVSKHGFKGKDLTNLRLINEFIIGVYYANWFEIKVKHHFIDAPRNLLKMMEVVRLQKKKVQDIVAPHIARSAWYSHSEAVLQTLLCSEDKEERDFAVERICSLRQGNDQGDLSYRVRVHSKSFNPKATKLTELCAWDKDIVHEPVLTCSLTLEDIKKFSDTPMVVPYRPGHGQSMERAVKQVTRACEAVFGAEARDGFIRAGVASRQVMPKNSSKKDLTRMVGSGK
jgi:hypothetical protein